MTVLPSIKTEAQIEVGGKSLRVEVTLGVREFGSTTPVKHLTIEGWRMFDADISVAHSLRESDIKSPTLQSQIAFEIGRFVERNQETILQQA